MGRQDSVTRTGSGKIRFAGIPQERPVVEAKPSQV